MIFATAAWSVFAEAARSASGVNSDPTLVQNFGVRTAQAEIGVLEPETNVTGTLAYNAREVAIVQPRASGFVQRTYGLAPDDIVRQGTPLVDLLIPEWGGAQREYLAVAATGDRESGGEGKSGSVRLNLGGRRCI